MKEVRKRLNDALKKQEKSLEELKKECRRSRRDPDIAYGFIWKKISKNEYGTILHDLTKQGNLRELEEALSGYQREESWEYVDNRILIDILDREYPNHSRILLEMSEKRLKNLLEEAPSSISYVLLMSDFQDIVDIVRTFSQKSLENAVTNYLKLFVNFLEKLCVHGDKEDKEEIFQNLAEISPAMLAKLLVQSNADVVTTIVREMTVRDIETAETYCEIEPENLFQVLEKSNYTISAKFPIEKLSAEERQTMFSFFKNGDEDKFYAFSTEEMITFFYPIVKKEDKAYILRSRLTTEKQLELLYESLEEDKRLEMLSILISEKKFLDAFSILAEREEELTPLEKIIFEDLKTKRG